MDLNLGDNNYHLHHNDKLIAKIAFGNSYFLLRFAFQISMLKLNKILNYFIIAYPYITLPLRC